ncbi:MAG: sulfotransferase family protein [Sulfitobacter sp.]|nr:sulfotransferase family protein [Sulfitobacter sp.]
MLEGPVISLSLPKSGTTTLAHALRHAGLKVADWRIRPAQTEDVNLQGKHVGPLIYEDYFNHGDPLRRLHEFDAVTEMNVINNSMSLWPQCDAGLLMAIERHHPKVKFLLSVREPGKVATSMKGWNSLGSRRLPQNDVPGLPRPYGEEVRHLTRWIESHYAFCIRAFRGQPNFLAYRLEDPDARQKISAFLEIDLPWWGQANANPAATAAAP